MKGASQGCALHRCQPLDERFDMVGGVHVKHGEKPIRLSRPTGEPKRVQDAVAAFSLA